uniref:Methylcrotonoyl-CoA carboxylase subunit alpha n=1 Tax=Arundo donax TaxID=35708 RepID=A0A0A9FAV2_ARUDO
MMLQLPVERSAQNPQNQQDLELSSYPCPLHHGWA